MGFFDEIVSMVGNRLSGSEQQNELIHGIWGLLNNPQHGGVVGLVRAFHDKGLGEIVSSWISTGQNLPISAEQIQQLLGSGQIKQIAQRMGISPEEASSALAALLPHVIDKLTPNGTLPEGALLEQGLSLLKSQLPKR
jgi:uncharacterized protein YidB (DUF937 family)